MGITSKTKAAMPKKGQTYLRQYELVDIVRAYDPSVDEALLNKAYIFSVKAHGTQMRHSGDPYYAHPIEVAGILAGLHLDVAVFALLYYMMFWRIQRSLLKSFPMNLPQK